MKSKYAELFTAKLNDMDLVLFEKHRDWGKWALASDSDRYFMVSNNFEYFLCLPRHKYACLHWLSGGKAEALHEDFGLMELADSEAIEWGVKSVFMKDSIEIRIKPKKEKRWIAIKKGNKEVGRYTCETLEEAKDMYIPRWWSHHEVEIEVEV